MKKETKNKIMMGCLIAIVVLAFVGFASLLVSVVSHLDTDTIIIDGNDIDSYVVTDDGMVDIVMKDGTKYAVVLLSDDEVIDFTVNSEIYIELYRTDIAFWWWEETKFGEDYYLERIIKIPNVGDE